MSILDIIFNSQNESILNSIVLFTAILASLISVSGYFYERSKKKRKEEKDEIIKVINQTRSELCKQMTDQREMLTGMIRNKEKFVNLQIDNLVDELTSDGYIKKIGRTKIYLTDDGRKRTEI